MDFMIAKTAQAGSSSGSSSGSSAPLKNSVVENDVVVVVRRMNIGSGENHGVNSLFVGRNEVKIGSGGNQGVNSPFVGRNEVKIGRGEDHGVNSPFVGRNEMKIGSGEDHGVNSLFIGRNEVKIGSGEDHGVNSPFVGRNEMKIGSGEDHGVHSRLSELVKIGGGEDHGVNSPFVDRNEVRIGVSTLMSEPVKICGGEDRDVLAPGRSEARIGVPAPFNETVKIGCGEHRGVVAPVVDRNEVKIGVPAPLKIGGRGDKDVVVPVADGNKVKIQVSVPGKLLGSSSRDDENNNKVKIEVPIPMKLLFPAAGMPSCHDHAQLLVQNYENFKKSGKPMRFMFYKNGSWVDFEKNVMDVMVSSFVSGKPVIEVEMEGLKSLVDFYRMLEIDLATGNEHSIAWIDVNGNCFFPKLFIDSSEDDSENFDKDQEIGVSNVNENSPKIEIEIKISDNDVQKEANNSGEELKLGKRKREIELEKAGGSSSNDKERRRVAGSSSNAKEQRGVAGSSSNAKERRVVAGSSSNAKDKRVVAATELHSARWPKAKALREEERGYQMVKRLLLSGLHVVDPSVIVTSVHQCTRTGPLEQARLEVFQKNVEIVKGARGNPKVVYAWCGTSAKNVEVILRHGFGMPSLVHGPNAHGVGIYLSPLSSPQNSAMMSPLDEYGEKHIILCRVILGNVEKVALGSQQMYPSSVHFDTGVDDLNNPKWYVVWCSNMNTHILPECVVSYRTAYALGTLISRLNSLLPQPKGQELQNLYGSYREGRVAKETFMRQLRSVVGNEMLRSTIQEIRG